MNEIPFYIQDLVVCLEEQGMDDNAIIGICCKLSPFPSKAAALICYLEKCNHTVSQILSYCNSL